MSWWLPLVGMGAKLLGSAMSGGKKQAPQPSGLGQDLPAPGGMDNFDLPGRGIELGDGRAGMMPDMGGEGAMTPADYGGGPNLDAVDVNGSIPSIPASKPGIVEGAGPDMIKMLVQSLMGKNRG